MRFLSHEIDPKKNPAICRRMNEAQVITYKILLIWKTQGFWYLLHQALGVPTAPLPSEGWSTSPYPKMKPSLQRYLWMKWVSDSKFQKHDSLNMRFYKSIHLVYKRDTYSSILLCSERSRSCKNNARISAFIFFQKWSLSTAFQVRRGKSFRYLRF